MIIDMHTHIGDLRAPGEEDRQIVTVENLIQRLDDEGIDKAVVLPMGVTPESSKAPFLFDSLSSVAGQLKAAASRPDRLILFGNLDPRLACLGNLEPHQVENPPVTDFAPFLKRFKEMGCVGIGEVTANLPLDNPGVINMFRQCGEWEMPVLFHCTGPGAGVYGLFDKVGLPGLEKLLIKAPDTVIIGHAPGFWSEISGDIIPENKFIYPEGPIVKEGSLQRLLRAYPNLYADISANSGFNAISRDKNYGVKFLNEFQDRVLFGTDVCYGDEEGRRPHLAYLRNLLSEGYIGREIFEKITGGNALRILKLYKSSG
ncbi:MAG: amidohydrolase family protein [Spirochaetales bacterium]|nr:amidohydrolase family protein [Spirochaetales bacterium]